MNPNQPVVQSHRGGGALAPENTLESFTATWALGAIPEADLRTTRDGVIVAFHDKDFSRVVKDVTATLREKGVADVTFEELAALDVGSWHSTMFAGQRVRRMEEIFAAMQGARDRLLYMDIKDVDLPHLAHLTRRFGVTEQVIFTSPREQLLREWKTLIPESQTLLWMGILRSGDENTLTERLESLRDTDYAGITQLQIHVEALQAGEEWQFKPSLQFLSGVAAELEARGILFQTLPWLCPAAEVYRLLAKAGSRSFASDYPEIALQALHEHQQEK